MNAFAWSFVMMLTLVLLELAILKKFHGQPVPWKEVIFNFNSGHILMWVFRGVEVAAFGLLLSHCNLHWVERWPSAAKWLFALIGWDFCFYWMHRLHHRWPIFWAVHHVHHEGEHFNLSLGIRNSWYSSLTSFPFVAILAVLGVPLETFVVVSSLHYSVQFYNHNGLVGKSGWLDRFFVTPLNHRVHHGVDPVYRDRNFGGTFLLWDKLFGTYQVERDDIPARYANGPPRSSNPLWANNQRLHQRIATRWPQLRNLRRGTLPGWYIGTGGVLLFGLVIAYVGYVESAGNPLLAGLFALIFLATIALGGISDDRHWGLVLWIATGVAMPIFMNRFFATAPDWILLLGGALALHTVCGGLAWLRPGAASPKDAQ